MTKWSLVIQWLNYGLYSYLLSSLIFDDWRHVALAAVAKNSAPFDPFRLECPFYHGIIKMELRRVESTEGIRTDTMITAYCENVKKLYPSPRDHSLAANDENCRWTSVFNIPGKPLDVSITCSGKEFVAGIARQDIGEYNILCCKLRDRKRGECGTSPFAWPSASAPQTNVEDGKRLLTSIGFKNGQLIGQFCDFGILTRQELDAEFLANAQTLLLTQSGQDQIKNTNTSKDGNVQKKITGRLRELATQQPTTRRLPSRNNNQPSATSSQQKGASAPSSKTQFPGAPQVKSPASPRPRFQQKTTTSSNYEYDYGDSGETDQQRLVTKDTDVKNGVVHAIEEPGDDGASSARSKDDDAKTTTPLPPTTRPPTTRKSTTTTTTTTSTTTTTTTTAVTSPPGTTESSTETDSTNTEKEKEEDTSSSDLSDSSSPSSSKLSSSPHSRRLNASATEKPSDEDQDTTATPSDDGDEGDKEGSDAETTKSATTPEPIKKTKKTTLTTTPPATTEPELELPLGLTVPDPARFQVLGVPKPVGSKPLRPHGLFIQQATGADAASSSSKGGGRPNKKRPGASTTPLPSGDQESESTSPNGASALAPAPPAHKTAGEGGSGDLLEMENEGSGSSNGGASSPSAVPENIETTASEPVTEFIELGTPPVPVGNLSADSAGAVINSKNESVDSAVAPQTPFFGSRSTTTPTPTTISESTPKDSTSGGKTDDGTNATTSASGSSSGGNATPVTSNGGGEADKVECDTLHGFKDPTTHLVVACGQGNNIWSPPRCPVDTFCLTAKDSTFRICCPVVVG